MNRETELHFSEIPEIHAPRSKFKRPFDHKTTFNAGDLIPIYLDQDILPGDTVKMEMASVVRMATPLYPVLDNAYMDIYFFFIPNRLLWTHWKEFWGENTNAWYQTVEYEIPQISTNSTATFQQGSVADYMGLPLGIANLSVSALPFRGYAKCWSDWFRDENLQQDAVNSTGDSTNATNSYASRGGDLLKANKFHDYFTSALPAPQKGQEVMLPLGTWAPVYTRSTAIDTTADQFSATPLRFGPVSSSDSWTANKIYHMNLSATSTTEARTFMADSPVTETSTHSIYPANLWTDLTAATASTISQLRQAIAIQSFYEAQARGGSRYIEFIKNIFGVTSPDARLQRSEYLGGKRIPINMQQVLQTSATDATSPQGNTAAFSHTADSHEYFTKSFTEHGILLGLACIRTDRTYGQGIEKGWSRKKWTDFYVPQFANLSEMQIKVKEIYATGTSADNDIFGFQEAWAEYRYKPNILTNSMRTTVSNTLDSWHYGDHYTSQPILGSTWIQEPKANIDRTLAVSSDVENQFIGDFYFAPTYVRPMPMYSVPGFGVHL